MQSFFIRGILIGLIFGVPAGVIGAMTVKRTLENGFIAGFVTGLGSMVADCFYGCIGICGLTAVSGFLLGQLMLIRLFGGGVIILFGIMTLKKKTDRAEFENNVDQRPAAYHGREQKLLLQFGSSFFIAVMNPAAILAFITAFASFGVLDGINAAQGCALICGIAAGTGGWWFLLAGTVSLLRRRMTAHIYSLLNKLLGVLMLLFGASSAISAVTG